MNFIKQVFRGFGSIFKALYKVSLAILRFLGKIIWLIFRRLLIISGRYTVCQQCNTIRVYGGSCPMCDNPRITRWQRFQVFTGYYHICQNCRKLHRPHQACPFCQTSWPFITCTTCGNPRNELRSRCEICKAYCGWYPFETIIISVFTGLTLITSLLIVLIYLS
jgi:hypothetical protein